MAKLTEQRRDSYRQVIACELEAIDRMIARLLAAIDAGSPIHTKGVRGKKRIDITTTRKADPAHVRLLLNFQRRRSELCKGLENG